MIRSSGTSRFVLFPAHHFVQMSCGRFNISVLVSARAAFRGDHCATMHSFEIAEWELVSPLGVRGTVVIHAQMPFRVDFESVGF
jgi:hypothetical protein